jgi:hypothetical protein
LIAVSLDLRYRERPLTCAAPPSREHDSVAAQRL